MNTRWSVVGSRHLHLSVATKYVKYYYKCAESFDLVPKPSNNEFIFKLNNLTNEIAKQMWINHHPKCDAIVSIELEKRMLNKGEKKIWSSQKPI